MEMRENKYAAVNENDCLSKSTYYEPKGLRKFLSTRNLVVTACLIVVFGLSNIIWMSTRYYQFCHREENMNNTACSGNALLILNTTVGET